MPKCLGNNLAFRLFLERVQGFLTTTFTTWMSQESFRWLHVSLWVFRNSLSSLDSFSSSNFSQHTSPTQGSLFQHAANRPPSLPHRALLYRIVICSVSFFTLGSEICDMWSYSLVTCDSVSKCIDIFGEKSSALHHFPRKFPGWDDQFCFLLSGDKSHSSSFSFFPLTALTWHIIL